MSHPDFRPRFIEQDDPAFLASLALSTALATGLQILVWSYVPPEDTGEIAIPERIVQVMLEAPDRDRPDPPEATGSGVRIGRKAPSEPLSIEQVSSAWQRLEEQLYVLDQVRWSDEQLDQELAAVSGEELPDGDQLTYRTGDVDTSNLGIGDLPVARTGPGGGVGPDPIVAIRAPSPGGGVDYASLIGELPVPRRDLDMPLLQQVIRGYRPQVKYCYVRTLKLFPDVMGRVELSITLADGEATEVRVLGDTTGAEGLADCLVRRVKTWGFPKDHDVTFEYPFVFGG